MCALYILVKVLVLNIKHSPPLLCMMFDEVDKMIEVTLKQSDMHVLTITTFPLQY